MDDSFDLGVRIPEEIMDEICLRIPATHLWQCRTVSSNWSRIKNNSFIHLHHATSKTYNASLIFSFMCHRPNKTVPYSALYRVDESHSQNLIAFPGHPTMTNCILPEIVAVCYGFVCIMYEIDLIWYFAISNPATNQIIRTNYPLNVIMTGMVYSMSGKSAFLVVQNIYL